MSRMNWIIVALLLIIPGLAGLGWGHLYYRDTTRQTAFAALAVSNAPSADEYLAMYDQWSQLTSVQKAENPWGQGSFGGPEIQKRLRQDQSLRLEADLPGLDAGLKSYPTQLAEVLYGPDWTQRLEDYRREHEKHAFIQVISAILSFAGGLLLCGGLIQWMIAVVLHNKQALQSDDSQPVVTIRQSKRAAVPASERKPPRVVIAEDPVVSADSDPAADDLDLDPEPSSGGGYFGSVMGRQKRTGQNRTTHTLPACNDTPAASARAFSASSSDKESYFGWAMEADEESSAVATMMTTEPVTNGLSELTEEVSAIRQYAAAQQDQMRKLQDGYDWMIVRRFCMRIIRCIDNLDDRRTRLGDKEQTLQACLEDIRDELVFALESSGIEQYQPDLNVPFKGLEKYAEAVRQIGRASCRERV